MRIVDRLPFADQPHQVAVQGEAVDVYRNQIIIWISIDDVLRPLPAILAGHEHNLSIGEGRLQRWSGASLEADWGAGDRPSANRAIRGRRERPSKRSG